MNKAAQITDVRIQWTIAVATSSFVITSHVYDDRALSFSLIKLFYTFMRSTLFSVTMPLYLLSSSEHLIDHYTRVSMLTQSFSCSSAISLCCFAKAFYFCQQVQWLHSYLYLCSTCAYVHTNVLHTPVRKWQEKSMYPPCYVLMCLTRSLATCVLTPAC